MKARIWFPAAADHAAWQALTRETFSRDDFERLVAAAAAEIAAAGHEVELAEVSPEALRAVLKERGLANTPAARAELIAAWPHETGRSLGLKLGANTIGWASVRGPEVLAAGETPYSGGDIAAAVRAILQEPPHAP